MEDEKEIFDPTKVLNLEKKFYDNLYSEKNTLEPKKCRDFADSVTVEELWFFDEVNEVGINLAISLLCLGGS